VSNDKRQSRKRISSMGNHDDSSSDVDFDYDTSDSISLSGTSVASAFPGFYDCVGLY
jgi:hypothetical protein